MNILNKVKIVFVVISIVLILGMILICGKIVFENYQSKNYRVGRFLNCIFNKEDYEKYLNEIEFCLENNLIEKTKKIVIYKLTDKGFDYMNSQNSLYIALIALIISAFSFCASMVSLLMTFISNLKIHN